jgi:hypothetical protein
MTAWTGAAGPAEEGPRLGSLEAQASLALKFLAVLNAAGIVLATIPSAIPASALQAFAFNVASAALAVLYLMVARGLDRRQPWAVSAVRPLLILLAVWGAYTFVTALTDGVLRIPFTTLAAGWALLGPADLRPLPRLRGRGGTVLVASAALIATVLAGEPVFGWGGFFDVHQSDLSASVTVDCGAPGATLPEDVTITYDWSWSGTTFLPNEEDAVVIGWNGDDADGHPLYVPGDIGDGGDGVFPGASSEVSAPMADEAAGHWRGSFRWRIDLAARGIKAGRIVFVLMRAAEQPRLPEPLVIGASYIHLGVWLKDVPTATCSW